MIELNTGTPGSGKSLNVARTLLIKARHGIRIIANFPMKPTKKQIRKGRQPEYWTNDEITPDKLMEYARKYHKYGKEGQTVIVLDECQLIFNSRDFRDKNRPKWIEFFSQHRKYGFDVILITQHDRLLDRQVRAFVEYNVIHRKVNNFGVPGFVISLLHIKLFVAVTVWYGLRERMGAEYFIYRKRLGRVYDSYQDFRLGSDDWAVGEGPAQAGGDLTVPTVEEMPPDITERYTPTPITDYEIAVDYENSTWGVTIKPKEDGAKPPLD